MGRPRKIDQGIVMTNQKECCSCNTLFTPSRSSNVFCTKACRQRVYVKDGRAAASVYKNYVKKTYGLTPQEIVEWSKQQGDCCKLCGIHVSAFTGKKKKLCVDHCHKTGKVRGLLCESCNSMLGMAKDNVDTLLRAVDYLKE